VPVVAGPPVLTAITLLLLLLGFAAPSPGLAAASADFRGRNEDCRQSSSSKSWVPAQHNFWQLAALYKRH